MSALTAVEAARHLGLHPRTVRRLAREGKLPRRKVGGRWRFPSAIDLDRWLAGEQAAPAQAPQAQQGVTPCSNLVANAASSRRDSQRQTDAAYRALLEHRTDAKRKNTKPA